MQAVLVSKESLPVMRDVASLTLSTPTEEKYLYFSTKNKVDKKSIKNLALHVSSAISMPNSSEQADVPTKYNKVFQLNKLVLPDEVVVENPYEGTLREVYDNALKARQNIESKDLSALGIFSADEDLIEIIRAAYYKATVPPHALFAEKTQRNKTPVIHNYMHDLAITDTDHYLHDVIVVAGGAVTDYILDLQPRDYDIFFVKSTHEWKKTCRDYINYLLIKFKVLKCRISELALSLTLLDKRTDRVIKVQLILISYSKAADIITGFDLPACACMYYQGQVWLTERCRWSLTNRLNYVDPTVLSNNYCMRLTKYAINKGIAVLVPNFDINVWSAQNNDGSACMIKNSLRINGFIYNNLGCLLQLHFMSTQQTHDSVDNMLSDYESDYAGKSTFKLDHKSDYASDYAGGKPPSFNTNLRFRNARAKRPYYTNFFDSSNLVQVATWDSFMSTELENYDIYESLIKVRELVNKIDSGKYTHE
jgi:hypothetical protein